MEHVNNEYKFVKSSSSETKVCPKCGNSRNLDHFTKGHVYCKKCFSNYTKERQQKTKQKCIDYLGGKCNDCGGKFSTHVYDFHHLDPATKEFGISKKLTSSFENLKSELDKCVLLCRNCHRKRHALEDK